MPLVVQVDSLSLIIRVRHEHPPPHVHVLKGHRGRPEWSLSVLLVPEVEVLRLGTGKPRLQDIEASLFLVKRHRLACLKLWEECHGPHHF